MKHYMKKIRPEQGYLIQASTTLSCRNVQIILVRRKCGVGVERVRDRYRQIDNMKHKYQLYVPSCQISNSSQIVIN